MNRPMITTMVVLLVPLAARAQSSDATTIDDKICLKCDDLIPPAAQLVGRRASAANPAGCDVDCIFEGKPRVVVSASCGKEANARRTQPLTSDAKPIGSLEDRAYSVDVAGDKVVCFSDKDTPCWIRVHWGADEANAEAKAIALARDVAKVLTPEVVAKRRTVDAIVWAQDKSGKKAQAVLDAWKVEGAAIAKLGAFSAGLPQVLDHAGREGLPDGKKSLLLGYCPTGKGDEVAAYWKPIFPGLKSYRVSAQGAPLSCPVKAFEVDSQPSSRTARVPDGELTVVSYVPTTKARHGRDMAVYASLRDKSARLVDSCYEQVFFDGYRLDKTKLQPSDAGMTIQVAYTMGPYPTCKKDPTRTKMITVGVADAKISIDASDVPAPTCLCCGGE